MAMARRRSVGLMGRYRGFSHSAKTLITAGVLSNLANSLQWFFLVLYLIYIGYTTEDYGPLASGLEFAMIAMILSGGYLADRFGRRLLVIIGIIFGISGFAVFSIYETMPAFYLGAILLGFGNGLEQPAFSALLAGKTSESRRKYLFSLNALMGQLGNSLMTLAAGFIPALLMASFGFEDNQAYRMIFVLALVLKSVALLLVLVRVDDKMYKGLKRVDANSGGDRRKPWGLLIQFGIPAAFAGLGAGMLIPYFGVYFLKRFDLELAELGIIFSLFSFVMFLVTILIPKIAEKRGSVMTATVFHTIATLAMITIPFAPWLSLVVFLYIFRATMMNVPHPINAAFMQSRVPEHCRALASSTTQFSWMVPHALGLLMGGWIWEVDTSLTWAFYIAFVLYSISTLLYFVFFYKLDDKKHGGIHWRPFIRNLYNR